jgi:hypothetical protein
MNIGVKNERLDFHSGLAEDLISLGCYTMSTGKYLPTLLESSNRRFLDTENKGSTALETSVIVYQSNWPNIQGG